MLLMSMALCTAAGVNPSAVQQEMSLRSGSGNSEFNVPRSATRALLSVRDLKRGGIVSDHSCSVPPTIEHGNSLGASGHALQAGSAVRYFLRYHPSSSRAPPRLA